MSQVIFVLNVMRIYLQVKIKMARVKSIVDIARENGTLLLQESNGWYKTTCPRHQDEHPTLRIAPDGDYWVCFACKKGGDPVSFIRWFNPSISYDNALTEVYGDGTIDWAILEMLSDGDNAYESDEAGAKLFYEAMKLNLLDKDKIDDILMSENSLSVLESRLCN